MKTINFNTLYKDHQKMVSGLAISILDTDDIKDTLQEVFIKLFMELHKYDESIGSLNNWIYTIAKNFIIDISRKKNQLKLVELNIEESQIPDTQKDIIEILTNEGQQKILLSIINKNKNSLQRIAIGYLYQQDMSIKEISEKMNISLNSAKKHIFRAKNQIKKSISKKMYENIR